jgi:DNA-binding transcriptional LysR family regulator
MESGTIATASDREHIAPSALSKRLSDLEYTLKTRLLERSNRGIEPTAAGTELLSLARGVLRDLDNIYAQIKEHGTGTRGVVRIFANISAIAEFMPSSLRSFMLRFPQVEVQLQEKISSAVQQGVASNIADVGVYAHGNSDAAGVISLPYQKDELVVVVPFNHPLATRHDIGIAETLEYDYVGLHTGSFINQQLQKAAHALDVPFKCRMQVTSFDALSLMVEAGMGIALMPKLIGERFSRFTRIRLLTLTEAWAHRELRICVRSIECLPVTARILVDHLRQEKVA